MLRSLVTLHVTILLLASASNTATAARVCIAGRYHYGGSGLHHDRVHAQASAVRAWRAVQAESHGARAASNMFPARNQIQCKHALGSEGWRCFVRGGPCHLKKAWRANADAIAGIPAAAHALEWAVRMSLTDPTAVAAQETRDGVRSAPNAPALRADAARSFPVPPGQFASTRRALAPSSAEARPASPEWPGYRDAPRAG